MARRVNTRFVFLLSSCLLLLIVGLVAFWYLAVRTDPAEHIARGDKFYEEGQYGRAMENYSRALGRRRNDPVLIYRYADASSRSMVADSRDAQRRIMELINLYRSVLEIDPQHEQAMQDLGRIYMRLGSELGDLDSWSQLYNITDPTVRNWPDDLSARRFRGIALINRMLMISPTETDLRTAREDLEMVLRDNPRDATAAYHLAACNLLEAKQLERMGGYRDQVAARRAEALSLTEQQLANHPDDVEVMLFRIRVLSELDKEADADLVADRAVARVVAGEVESRQIIELSRRLMSRAAPRTVGGEGEPDARLLNQAASSLRAGLARKENDLGLLATLGQLLQAQNKIEEALEVFGKASKVSERDEPLKLFLSEQYRRSAQVQYADMKLRQADTLTGDERTRVLAEAEALIAQLRMETGQSGFVSLLEGKLFVSRSEWGQALIKFDQANQQFENGRPSVLLLAANAAVQLGELGAGAQRLRTLIETRPDFLPARYELAKLYLRMADVNAAEREIEVLLRARPNDYEALRLRAVVLNRRGRFQQVIDLYRALDPVKNPDLIVPMARQYQLLGQTEESRRILEARFAQVPSDADVLRELIRITPDTARQAALIEQARRAGADAQTLAILSGRMEGRSDREISAAVEQLLQSELDPVDRLMSRYHLYRRMGREDQAEKVLSEAASMAPDAAGVIDAQFGQAIAARDWAAADRLASQAATANSDLAEGAFYKGQIDLARGRSVEAIVHFRRGLSARPVFSDGWRLLGDAQRLAGDANAAANSYQRAIEQRPDNILARRNYANSLNADGQFREALEQFRQIMQFSAQDEVLREEYLAYEQRHGEPERALRIRTQLAQLMPDNLHNRRGVVVLLARLNRMDEARAQLAELVKQEGVNRENVGTEATMLLVSGDRPAAGQVVDRYITSLGARAAAEDWLMAARLRLSIGDKEGAVQAYEQAVARDKTTELQVSRELADVYFDMDEFDRAATLYRRIWDAGQSDLRVGHRTVEAMTRANNLDAATAQLAVVRAKLGTDAGSYLLEALIAQHRKDPAAAVAAVGRAIELAPDRAIAYYQRAVIRAQELNRPDEAIADLRKALELDPGMSIARRLLARIQIERGSPQVAIDQLREVLTRRPNDLDARRQLMGLYLSQGDRLQTASLLAETRQLFPKDPMWVRLQAELAIDDRNPRQAVKYLEELFDLSPDAQTLGALATQHVLARRPADAIRVLQQHGAMTASDPRLVATLGRAFVAQRQASEAQQAFQQALAGVRTMDHAFGVAEQLVAAYGVEQVSGVLDQLPEGPVKRRLHMGVARQELDAGQSLQAANRLKRIRSQVPDEDNVPFRGLFGIALHNSGEFEAAREIYETILKEDPRNVAVMNNLAYLLANDLNRPQEGLTLAERAIEAMPDDPQVLDTLGWVQFKAGLTEQAERHLRRSARLKSMAANHWHLAELLISRGDRVEATDLLNRAKRLAEEQNDKVTLEAVNRRLAEMN